MSVSVTADDLEGAPEPKGTDYIRAERGVVSWLTTVDHKRIGLMYLVSVLAITEVAMILWNGSREGPPPSSIARHTH